MAEMLDSREEILVIESDVEIRDTASGSEVQVVRRMLVSLRAGSGLHSTFS